MDGSGEFIDGGRTYNGLRISAGAVFIDTTVLATKAQGEPDSSYNKGQTTSLNASYFSLFDPVPRSVTVATPDGGSTTIDYISTIKYNLTNITGIQFKNGLLISNNN